MQIRLLILFLFPGFTIVGVSTAVVASFAFVGKAVEMTSGADFCISCHSMSTAVESYRRDLHGLKSAHGARPSCADCHLPQDNLAHHLVVKAQTGLHDLLVETFTDTRTIDWPSKRHRREEFVYDSGCLKCHGDLQTTTLSNSRVYVGHRPYFAGRSTKKCVSCHPSVGHQDRTSSLRASL